MKPLALSIFNSILLRILALTFTLLLLILAGMITVMQTPLANTVFDRTIEENSEGIAQLVWLIESSPPEAEPAVLSTYQSRSRIARIQPAFSPELRADAARRSLLVSQDGAATQRIENREIRFQTLRFGDLAALNRDNPARPFNASSALHIAIGLSDGRVLDVWLNPSIFYTERPYSVIASLGMIAVVTLGMGLAIYAAIMRPIHTLERDASIVGLAETAIPVSETGPLELRRLSRALNEMRQRLAGLVREREQIMVAIAHDIRTGLAKLRLRIHAKGNVSSKEAESDLAQIERLLSDMMAYARAENPVTDHELVDASVLLAGLAKAAPYEVTFEDALQPDTFTIAGSRVGLTRLFDNLLENARRYGGGMIRIVLAKDDEGFVVDIEDNGPGIAQEDLESLFDPFVRGESSRNRETGGTGLGLGIARAIARTHGAEITLTNRSEGGLRARVLFPGELAA